MKTKSFDLATLLTVTTNRLLTDIDNLYKILGWMTDDSPFTHQLPRFADECRPFLLEWFPHLVNASSEQSMSRLDALLKNETNVKVAIATWMGGMLGGLSSCKEYAVPRIAAESHANKHPIDELVEAVGADKVIVIAKE